MPDIRTPWSAERQTRYNEIAFEVTADAAYDGAGLHTLVMEVLTRECWELEWRDRARYYPPGPEQPA